MLEFNENNVRLLHMQAVADWNESNFVAFCSNYTTDAIFMSPKSTTEGRANILQRYRAAYGNKMTSLSIQLEHCKCAMGIPGIAGWAVVRWTLSWIAGASVTGLAFLTYVQTEEGLKISRDCSV